MADQQDRPLPGMEPATLAKVLELSRQMAQTRALGPLLVYAMAEAAALVGAERGYLVLLGPDGTLDFRAAYNRNSNDSHSPADDISKTILTHVVESGKALVLRDAAGDVNFKMSTSVVMLRIRSVMCVPLMTGGRALGAIYVENRSVDGRFSERDLPPLELFANQAAVAIENTTLIDELETRITERTRELEQLKDEATSGWMHAVESNRMFTAWLGYISHDLRAPLSVVSTTLNLIIDDESNKLEPELQDLLKSSFMATQRALTLSNEILDITRIEMGGMRLNCELVDVRALMQNVYQVGKGLPWPPEVQLILELPDALPTASLDSARIEQVLINLLSNALKFTRRGTVTLYAGPVGEGVLFGVRDTGDGIPADKVEKVFDRFVQASGDRRQFLGAGLGLAISRELVELHGGRIWAESELGVGSDFKFVVPLDTPITAA